MVYTMQYLLLNMLVADLRGESRVAHNAIHSG